MGRSHLSLYIHYVFSTGDCEPFIERDLEARIWAYVGGILNKNGITPPCIGGMPDHVHVPASLPGITAASKGVQLMKGGSGKWIREWFLRSGVSEGRKDLEHIA